MDNLTAKIAELKQRGGAGVKPITISRYVGNLRKLFADMGRAVGTEAELLAELEDTEAVMAELSKKGDATRKGYLNSIIVALDSMKPDSEAVAWYRGHRDVLNKKYFEAKATNTMNAKEEDTMLSFAEWDKVIADIDAKITAGNIRRKKRLTAPEYLLMLQYLIVKLYRRYPLRNDYAGMKVMTVAEYKGADGSGNYCVLGRVGGRFILNDYKTNSTYGTITVDIDPETLKMIRDWLRVKAAGAELLCNMEGKAITRNGLTKLLQATFSEFAGRAIGSQTLRKSYLSSKYGENLAERKKDAAIMGHSLNTQQTVYTKTDTGTDGADDADGKDVADDE